MSGMAKSYQRSATAYRRCLRLLGHEVVKTVEEADVVVVQVVVCDMINLLSTTKKSKRRPIVYTTWDLNVIPPVVSKRLDSSIEIWTPSSFCQKPLSEVFSTVKILPHVIEKIDTSVAWIDRVRSHFSIPKNKFVFYSFSKKDKRKNQFAAGEAYNMSDVADCFYANIDIGSLQDKTIGALHEICDCFVSLHRSEGWGLCISEALAHGNHVVSSSHGGCMEFLDEVNSHLVWCKEIPVDDPFYCPRGFSGMVWGDPSINDAAAEISHVAKEHYHGPNLAAAAVVDRFSEAEVAKRLGVLLDDYVKRAEVLQ